MQKLEEAKLILIKVQQEHPEYFANRSINGKLSIEGDQLYESYFQILKLAHIEDPFYTYVTPDERVRKSNITMNDTVTPSHKCTINGVPY